MKSIVKNGGAIKKPCIFLLAEILVFAHSANTQQGMNLDNNLDNVTLGSEKKIHYFPTMYIVGAVSHGQRSGYIRLMYQKYLATWNKISLGTKANIHLVNEVTHVNLWDLNCHAF